MMNNIAKKKLIRDATGSPIPQFYDEEQGIFVPATNSTGDASSVDFTKKKLIRDALGGVISQYFDVLQNKFVPSTSEGGGGGGSGDWNDIINKPTTFPPSPHTHVIGNVEGLQSELDDKANQTDLTDLKQTVTEHLEQSVYSANGAHGLKIDIGSFSPTIEGLTTPGTATYSMQDGKYLRIGNLLKIDGRVRLSSISGSTGQIIIGGLPYPVSNTLTTSGRVPAFLTLANNITGKTVKDFIAPFVSRGGVILIVDIDGVDATALTNSSGFDFSVTYFVD